MNARQTWSQQSAAMGSAPLSSCLAFKSKMIDAHKTGEGLSDSGTRNNSFAKENIGFN